MWNIVQSLSKSFSESTVYLILKHDRARNHYLTFILSINLFLNEVAICFKMFFLHGYLGYLPCVWQFGCHNKTVEDLSPKILLQKDKLATFFFHTMYEPCPILPPLLLQADCYFFSNFPLSNMHFLTVDLLLLEEVA